MRTSKISRPHAVLGALTVLILSSLAVDTLGNLPIYLAGSLIVGSTTAAAFLAGHYGRGFWRAMLESLSHLHW